MNGRLVWGLPLVMVAATVCAYAQRAGGTASEDLSVSASERVETMDALVVTAGRVETADVESPQDIDQYNAQDIDDSGAFSVEEFISNLPPAEEGAAVLVLIDGRPTYLDPSSLPIGMIASMEVTDHGSMPQYGAYNNGGRIINIRLKKDYASREIGGRFGGAFDGGASSRTARFAGAVNRSALRVIYSVELSENRPLLASDRAVSRNQDFRDRGGRDLRLAWGVPAVVSSLSGPLAGLPGGGEVALVPDGAAGAGLQPGDFLAADPEAGVGAENQRRFNTAGYRWLTSPSQRASYNLGFTYTINEYVQFSLNGSHTDSRGERMGAPPVTPVSEWTEVPAAYNPFGQDVAVGLVHVGFGPTLRETRSKRDQIGFDFNGKVAGDWRWEASAGHRRSRSRQAGAELDPVKFSASLVAADPAERFDPFIDETRFDTNTALYPSLSSWRRSNDASSSTEAEVSARGPVLQLPGGPAQLRVEVEVDESTRERLTTRVLGEEPELSERSSASREFSSSISLPFASSDNPLPWARRLETQLAGQWGSASDGEKEWDAETGLVWAPSRALVFRARYQHNVETPSRDATAGSEVLVGETLIDLQRDGEAVTSIRAFTRETVEAEEEVSGRYSFGVTLEPSFLPGLRLSASYSLRKQERMFEDDFDPQEIIYNEAAFAGRVIRAEPTAADLAAGRPGSIVALDLTPGNTGESERGEADYEISYRLRESVSGRWRFSAKADQSIRSVYEIMPGVPFIAEAGGGYNRPRWAFNSQLSWSRGSWNASTRVRHTAAIAGTEGALNGVAAYTNVDFNAGYRWRVRMGGDRTRDLRINVGIGNIFDRDPPFADNVSGYRGGSPLGRTYSIAARVEL